MSVIGSGRGRALDQQSTRRSLSSKIADPTDLVPVTPEQFAAELAPCLALVAPVGMDEAAKRTWYGAAFRALDGIPIGLLKRGATAAMASADHPAKIVPAIMREIGGAWDQRRKLAVDYRPPDEMTMRAPLSSHDAEEVGKLMRGLANKLRDSIDAEASR